MSHRANVGSLPADQRRELVALILKYLTDAIVARHASIVHSGHHLLTGHRGYLAELEQFLTTNKGSRYVPLPYWTPAEAIPPEFNVVKATDSGRVRPPLRNLTPELPLPPEFRFPGICKIGDGEKLGDALNGWHGSVHVKVGGAMGSLEISPAAPIFWCWHAYIDDVYWAWERCTR